MFMKSMIETKDLLIFLNHYFGMVELQSYKPPHNTNLSSRYTYELTDCDFLLDIIENSLGWVVEFSLYNDRPGRFKARFKIYIWSGGLYQDTEDEAVVPISREDIFPNIVNYLQKHYPELVRDVKLEDLLD
jgi:hypothetical protein